MSFETPSSHEITDIGLWDRAGNIEAWKWYLGDGKPDQYAAPARAEDLTGLPPTFIDVGTVDLFRDEDITFAMRLMQAGVPTELHVIPLLGICVLRYTDETRRKLVVTISRALDGSRPDLRHSCQDFR